MLFDIEEDTGDQIIGYLVPDSYSTSATVVVTSQGRQLAVLPTKENRPSVVAAGRHGSGRCGFTIDGKVVPKLRKYLELELRDEASGLCSSPASFGRVGSDEVISSRAAPCQITRVG